MNTARTFLSEDNVDATENAFKSLLGGKYETFINGSSNAKLGISEKRLVETITTAWNYNTLQRYETMRDALTHLVGKDTFVKAAEKARASGKLFKRPWDYIF